MCASMSYAVLFHVNVDMLLGITGLDSQLGKNRLLMSISLGLVM